MAVHACMCVCVLYQASEGKVSVYRSTHVQVQPVPLLVVVVWFCLI